MQDDFPSCPTVGHVRRCVADWWHGHSCLCRVACVVWACWSFVFPARHGAGREGTVRPCRGQDPSDSAGPAGRQAHHHDGLAVRAAYFASSLTERTSAVPIVLLHSWKSDGRKEFEGLAKYLQAEGHAVLVPDLRGHGQSKKFQGTDVPLDQAKLRNADFADMVTKNMEAWRSS